MDQKPTKLGHFLTELKRRHVWRAAIAYAAVSFVLLQAGEIVLPVFEAPEWALRLLVVVTLLAFPVVLVLAWIYEITPQGIRRTQDLEVGAQRLIQPSRLLPRLALLGVTVVTVGVIGWWMMTFNGDSSLQGSPGETAPMSSGLYPVSSDPSAPIRSLAVLPFQDFSDLETDDQAYFSAGMHEAVVWQLSQLASVRVVSRTSVTQYAGTTKTTPQISRELGVQGIIEGSVLRSGDRVQITVQLIHGPTDTHLWSQRYERDLTDVIALQNEVALAIANEIQAEITPDEQTRLASLEEANPEAHMEFMRGRMEASKETPEGHQEAIQHFQEAVKLDSTYAPAYAGLAGSQFLLEMSESDSTIDLRTLVQVATKAVELDAESPEAQAVLSEINRYVVVMAESLNHELTAVAGVNVVDSVVVPEGAWGSEFTEFGSQAQRIALSRDTADRWRAVPLRRVGGARYLAAQGRYDDAEAMLRTMLEHDPSFDQAWEELEYIYVMRGDYAGAVEVRRERMEKSAAEVEEASASDLERAVAERSARGYWELRLAEFREREAQGGEQSQVDIAAALVALGRYDEAMQSLELAVEQRDRKLYTLGGDPVWDPVRGDPRFLRIIERVRRAKPAAPERPRTP
jgi:TolB-like protein